MTTERLPDGPDLNVGVDRETFERLVGGMGDPDYAAVDRFVPHPVYARQRWISVASPAWPMRTRTG